MIELYDELFILFVKVRPAIRSILCWYFLLSFSVGHSLLAATVEFLLAFFLLFHFLFLVCLILWCIVGGRRIEDFLLTLASYHTLLGNRLLIIIEVKIAGLPSKRGHADLTTIISLDRPWCRLTQMLRKDLLKALGVIIILEFLDPRWHFLKPSKTMTQDWKTQMYIQPTPITGYFSACFGCDTSVAKWNESKADKNSFL